MAKKRNKTSWNKIESKASLLYENKHKFSGVYQIKHKKNGRIYIGSAVCFQTRWQKHLYDLRNKRHYNSFLQNDYNKTGEDKFEFTILQIVYGDKTKRQQAEQQFLDKLWLETSKNQRYNFVKKAVVVQPKKRTERTFRTDWHWFVNPNGIEYVVQDLSSFCEEFELNHTKMIKLLSGKLKNYKNWVISPEENRHSIIINTKTGQEFGTNNIIFNSLAEELDIQQSHLSKLLSGRRKSCGDWKVKDRIVVSRPHKGKVCWIISPEEEKVKITNIKLFANKNNLEVSGLRNVISGKSWTHKGWRRCGLTKE